MLREAKKIVSSKAVGCLRLHCRYEGSEYQPGEGRKLRFERFDCSLRGFALHVVMNVEIRELSFIQGTTLPLFLRNSVAQCTSDIF